MKDTPTKLYEEAEDLLYTLARLYAQRGQAKEVAVLADATPLLKQTGYDSDWGEETYFYTLYLSASLEVYSQLTDEEKREVEDKFAEELAKLFRFDSTCDHLRNVVISAKVTKGDPQWREKAKAWSSGKGLTNQGRVRSANIASKTIDGLLFRSQPEIYLYQALKRQGVSFAPLPVFLRGGDTFQRMEPDFIVIKDGVVLHVEVDGDTVHTETPAESQMRVAMLEDEGVHVHRIPSSECDNPAKAENSARNIIEKIKNRKSLK